MRRIRLAAAVGSLLLVPGVGTSLAQSEASIRAEVVAAADASLLPRAVVTLTFVPTGASTQAAADGAGRFVFQDLAAGEYVLSASAEGFAPRSIRLMVEPREVRMVTLRLDLKPLEVGVEVAGDASPVSSTHSPSSTLLTADRLQSAPAGQQVSLPDALVTAAPGMIRGHDDFVHIRGHEVALNPLINGVAFWENPHALFSPGVSPAIIESANVMTGAFPAEYGNRFGGVVDIVTRSGLRMQNEGSAAISGGQEGRRRVTADFGGHRGRVGYFASGSMFESDRFLSPPHPEAIHDSGRGGHAFFQVDTSLQGGGLLRAIAMGSGANFEIPKTPTDVEHRPLAAAEQRTRQQTAIASWSRVMTRVAVGATFYQRWSRSELLPAAGPLTAQAGLERGLLTVGGKADVSSFAGRHALKAGLDVVRLRPDERLSYRYDGYRELTHLLGLPHIHIVDNAIDFDGREGGGQVSAYVQDTVSLGNRLTADVGVRVDRYDLLVSATHASPRVNVAFEVGRGAVVHASYNRFFVPPPIEGVLSSSAGLTARIREIGVALSPLEPTTEDQFELGASTGAGPVRLALTGYYRATDNPVHTTVWPDSRIYSYASFDRERAYGLEAKAEVPRLTRYGVMGYLNYALGRVYFYNPTTGGFVTEAAHLTETSRFLAPMDQTHTLTAGITYRPRAAGPWLATSLEYGSGTPMGHGGSEHEHGAGEADHAHAAAGTPASRVPGHVTANLSVGVDVWRNGTRGSRLSFQLDLENLTDNQYLIAQESEFSPGQFSVPRLVSGTLRVRF
jgi:outer membrane receptor protein involved in Fe transport